MYPSHLLPPPPAFSGASTPLPPSFTSLIFIFIFFIDHPLNPINAARMHTYVGHPLGHERPFSGQVPQQLPLGFSHVGGGALGTAPLPSPRCNFDWLDFVQVTTANVI